jgi:hypothetical protein
MAQYAADNSADSRACEAARNYSGPRTVMALARFADSVAGAGANRGAYGDTSHGAPSQLARLLHPCAAGQKQHQACRHDQQVRS